MSSIDAPANPTDHIFRTQLKAFVSGLEQQPVPEVQDLRAGTLAFIAAFAPEALSATSIKLLADTRARSRSWESFQTELWWRIPFLDATLFNLRHDIEDMRIVIENLSHRTRGIRTHLFAPLGLALPRLDLDQTSFVQRMAENLDIGHLGNDQGFCILLASDMPLARKRAILEHWHAIAANDQDKERAERALSGRPIENHTIQNAYLLITLHLAECAFTSQRDALPLFSITPAEMIDRAKAHPLMQPSLCL